MKYLWNTSLWFNNVWIFADICVDVIDFALSGKSLTGFTNLFLSNKFKKNDKVILDYFLNCNIKMVQTSTNGKINMYRQ